MLGGKKSFTRFDCAASFFQRGHLGVGGELHSFLSGHTVTGVEDGRSGDGPEQG